MSTKTRFAILAILLSLVCTPVLGDDTEIYIGQDADNEDNKDPNVLFIMDVSGSMDGDVEVEHPPYDDSVNYDDICIADGNDDRIYWDDDDGGGWNWDAEPPCGGNQWINSDAMLIDEVTDSLASSSGMAIHKAAHYEQETKRECDNWDWERNGHHWDKVCTDWDEWTEWDSEPLEAGEPTVTVDYREDEHSGWDDADQYGFYTPNYINWYYGVGNQGRTTYTRLQVAKDVASDLVNSISGINIGLMRFDDDAEGGFVDLAVGPITDNNDATTDNREKFINLLGGDPNEVGYPGTDRYDCVYGYGPGEDGYCPRTNTPLAETMYEAALYLRGEAPEFGLESEPKASTPASLDASGTTYDSPIEYSCQKTHIVYLTDGEPTADGQADDEIEALTGLTGGSCDFDDDDCLDELAKFLYENDQRPDLPGTQRVITHTIGFYTNQDLLKDAAREGHGEYYTVEGYDALKTALTTLFTNITSSTSTFTAPAVSVNAFNQLKHLNQVYYALFRPSDRAVWRGNVKRYKIVDGQLVDAHKPAQSAIDESTGQFKDTAQSFWSDEVDGNEVALGGVAGELGQIDPDNRDTYTELDDGDADMEPLDEDDTEITAAMLGLSAEDADDREPLLKWIRGVDIDDDDGDGDTDDARGWMGDPLHARPLLVTYGDNADDRQLTLFVMTNEGYLHAIDADDPVDGGSELWAFMPKELLSNIAEQYDRSIVGQRTYGLDGPLSATVDRTADDPTVYLYFGMRRGGRNYYAMDASDRDNPKLRWTIDGGEGEFAELGQTFSQPIPTQVKINNDVKDVLIFTGGNDPTEDMSATRTSDTAGRAIFIVDADDGTVLWAGADDSAAVPTGKIYSDIYDEKFTGMDYSIPSSLRVLDINNDGLADQMYVGDMGGQIWRFDIDNGKSVSDLVTGGVIAQLSDDEADDADGSGNRRFYYPPDIALIDDDGQRWLSLSIGSGWRAHPLDEVVDDRFYMIHIADVFGPPKNTDGEITYTAIDEDNLYNATANTIGHGTLEQGTTVTQRADALDDLNDKDGWYIQLTNSGEKVLAPSVTLTGQVVFTTYQPSDGSSDSCGPGAGIARTYIVNVLDATPMKDMNNDGKETAEDRHVRLKRGGIPPAPTVVFIGDEPQVLVGTEQPAPDINVNDEPELTYWRQE